jgi:metal-responsive CopG/Arc/MetJ family transcriptional regulator
MKVRASITLSRDLLRAIDEHARQREETRSAFIEAALQAFVERSVRDLQIINEHADSLNQEAADVLEYQNE